MNLYSNLLSAVIGASLAVLAMLMSADHEKQQAKIVKPDSFYKPAVELISCDRKGYEEIMRVCRARKRMAEVTK